MSTPYQRLIAAQARAHTDQFAPLMQREALKVVSVDRDSVGNALIARGTIGGEGDFSAAVMGTVVEVGEYIEVGYPKGQEAGAPLEYLRHLASDYAGAGSISQYNFVPAPVFDTTPFTSDTKGSDTNVGVTVTAWFRPVEAKELPSGYIISYRYTPPGLPRTDWIEQGPIPPLTDDPFPVGLSTPFAPGTTVDVKARTLTSRHSVPSEEGAIESFICPADTASPGTPSGFTADNTVTGELKLTAGVATIDQARFAGVRWEVANDSLGTGLVTATVVGEYHHRGTAGAKWIALRFVAKSGTLGPRVPSSGYTASPVPILAAAAALDTTPPNTWAAPTLAMRDNTLADGTKQVYLKVTFPTYTYASTDGALDYDFTIVRVYNGTTYDEWHIAYNGTAHDPVERLVDYGTYVVSLRGADKAGNRGTLSATASVSLAAGGAPSAASFTAIDQIGLAFRLRFTMPAGANTVEIQRSDDAGGTLNLVTRWDGTGTSFLDLLTDVAVGTQKWYRLRGRNNAGDGAWSAFSAVTLQAVSGSYIGANTLQGDRVIAGTLDAGAIQTNTILAALLKTAASGSRWEIEGHTGGGSQDQIRLYDGTHLRLQLLSSGLYVIQDNGYQRVSFDSGGMTLRQDNNNLRAVVNANGLYIYNDANTVWAGMQQYVSGEVALQLSDGSVILGNVTKQILNSGAAGDGIYLGYSSAPILLNKVAVGGSQFTTGCWVNQAQGLVFSNNATQGGTPGAWFGLRPDGTIGFGTGANYADVFIARMNGSYGLGFDLGAAALHAQDIYATRTGGNSHKGYTFLGDQSGGQRLVGYDGTNYVMPGASLYVNGSIVLTSDRETKAAIKPLRSVKTAMRALTPATFRRRGHPDAPTEVGYIAQDVEAAIPEAVVLQDWTPPPTVNEAGEEVQAAPVLAKGINPVAILAAVHQWVREEVAAIDARFAAIEARLDKGGI